METRVETIRVLVADDHALLRHGLRALLADAGGFEVVGEAENGRRAVYLAAQLEVDLVLLDTEMPGYSALEALRQIGRMAATRPGARPRVLLLGTRADEEDLLRYLRAGACGLVLKEAPATELIGALRDAHHVGTFVSPLVSRRVLNRWHSGYRSGTSGRRAQLRPPAGTEPPAGEGSARLSDREREVLDHVAAGLANRQIAERLCISVKTVEAHKAHMVSRLGLRSTHDLVRYAVMRVGA